MAWAISGEELGWEREDDTALMIDVLQEFEHQVKMQQESEASTYSSLIQSLQNTENSNGEYNCVWSSDSKEHHFGNLNIGRLQCPSDCQFRPYGGRYMKSSSPPDPPACHSMSIPWPPQSGWKAEDTFRPGMFALQLATSFGRASVITIPINPGLSGAIIGRKGVNAKRICRKTGLRALTIREHTYDRSVKFLIMQGSVEVICEAIHLVRHLILYGIMPCKQLEEEFRHEKYKTKLCSNFSSGFCSYGNMCQFAHGLEELRVQPTYLPV